MSHGPQHWSKTERALARFAELVIDRRGLTLALLAAITVALGLGIPKINVDNSNELWFVDGDSTVTRYEEMKENFGTDSFIYFLLERDDVFTPETLADLETLEEMLLALQYREESVFEEVTHLGNVNYIRGDAVSIEVVGLAEGVGRDAEGMRELRRRTFAIPNYERILVNRKGTATGVIGMVRIRPNDSEYHVRVTADLRSALAKPPFSEMNITMAGGPILDADMDHTTATEGLSFGALAILANLLAMVFLFRRVQGVLLPGLVVAMTLIWTFGLMGHVGASINVVAVILPALLVAVSISDTIHILSEYQTERAHGADRREAIVRTVAQVGLSCSFTTTTTVAGMLSLTLTPIPPVQTLGLFAAVGVFVAYVVTMLAVPALLVITGLPLRTQSGTQSAPDRWTALLEALSSFTVRRAKPITVVGALCIAAALFGASQVRIETNFVQSFDPEFPTRKAFGRIDDTLGGTSSLQLVIDTGTEGGVKEPEFLRELEALETWLEDGRPAVMKTLSITDLIKNMNWVLFEQQEGTYAIPDTRAAVAQELILYENADPDGLFKLVTDDYRFARLDIRTISGGTTKGEKLMRDVEAKAAEIWGDRIDYYFTGISQLFVEMSENLSRGQIRSYMAAFVMILLMMALVLKSLSLGIWSMIPNLLPVVITMGVMGLFDMPLDFVTLLIACVAIGIAVDDTIHFLIRFKKELAAGGDYPMAVHRSLTSVGRAMTFTTVTLVLGFLMFVPSVSLSVRYFGALVALTVSVALIADLLLMPAILSAFQPVRTLPENNATPESRGR